ncbi:hypothetical protein [Herbaspirillum sp. SJZ107]|uniref:hypothetical protein n=1 Tax=Herbaspirillum sp. SJZ107 TaxID=2572881 RepID=UPI00114E0145|nr:hypothetical protein [Herbaspirillum sp. SJZ107]
MSRLLKSVVVRVGVSVIRAVRFSFYVVLVLIGRVLVPIVSLAVVGGLVLFGGALLFFRDQVWLLVLGAGMAAGGVVLQVFYEAALRLVAPDDVVIVREL